MKIWAFSFLLVFLPYASSTQSEGDENHLRSLLSEQENTYLQSLDFLTVCNVAQAASTESSIDLVRLLLQKTGIELRSTTASPWNTSFNDLQVRNCDILPWATMVSSRLDIMGFTRPFARIKRVVVTKRSEPYIRELSEIKNEVFAAIKNNYLLTQIRKQYPNIRIIETDGPAEALTQVADGKSYGAFASLYSVANLFDQNSFSDLKIAGILPPIYDDVVSLATRKEDKILLGILDKAILTAEKSEIENFLSRGATMTLEPSINYNKYWFPIFFVVVCVIVLVWWNKNLRGLNLKLEATHLELEQKTKELERLSSTDTLTNTFNRIKLDQVFSQEIDRAVRYNQPLSIFMIDIDYFKNVNDSYGHLVGDKVLTTFAKTLKDNLRGNDILGRWGGEEFLVICPSIELEKAEMVAEKLRGIIEQTNFSPVDRMTASFGVTKWEKSDTQESLISRADYAMYLSKNRGRNKVSVSTEKPT